MLSLTLKCFIESLSGSNTSSSRFQPFWSLPHPFPQYYLFVHISKVHIPKVCISKVPCCYVHPIPHNDVQLFFPLCSLPAGLWKKTIIKEFTHVCVYTLTSICLAQWNICSQCKNVLEQIAQDLSLMLRAPKHKNYTFCVSCRFLMILLVSESWQHFLQSCLRFAEMAQMATMVQLSTKPFSHVEKKHPNTKATPLPDFLSIFLLSLCLTSES